jgi:CRP-like cAMP-binding protein
LIARTKPIDHLSKSQEVVQIHFPQFGAISIVTELSSGQIVECAMVGRDGVVGGTFALGDRISSYTAMVQVAGQSQAMDIDPARWFARENQEFRTAIAQYEQFVFAQVQQSAACNATHHLPERLARWLLRVRQATESDQTEVTQETIAEMLGVGRTTVSVTAHNFQKAGLIEYRRGKVHIKNLEGLREVACECHDMVQTHRERLSL